MRFHIRSAYLLIVVTSALQAQGTPMTRISPELGQNFDSMRQRLASVGEDLATNAIEVRLVKDQHSEATIRGFTVTQDEPATAWGTAKGPTPTDYFVASIGFCENVIFARTASMAKLTVDSLETAVSGSWDRRGLFEIDGTSPFFKAITVETRVSTRDPVEKVAEVARLTHRRCPVHATLSRAIPMTFKLVVNGHDVPL